MQEHVEKLNTILNFFGFREAKLSVDEEHRKILIVIDDEVAQSNLTALLASFEHLFNLILRRAGAPTFVIDVNYYRRERERLIGELARAAAHKAMVTKADVELPPMNSYERRLVHMEITTHPDLKTESVGVGKERRVVIKRITE
ncbi:MAG: R3H domain-containing nucleic acid-binding protein [Patescibacteria group bacterium]